VSIASGGVYLLCWADQGPIGNLTNPRGQATHYVGYARSDLAHRLGQQLAGSCYAARIMQATVRQYGRQPVVAMTWIGAGRDFERTLKARKSARRFCPNCKGGT
jgi:hypothetical protein